MSNNVFVGAAICRPWYILLYAIVKIGRGKHTRNYSLRRLFNIMDYSNILTRNIQALPPSGIRKFFSIAAEYDDVISLSIGEPDFKTPWKIRQEGVKNLQKGHTWYTANSGLLKLREEISSYLSRRYSLKYDCEEEILITVGGSEGIDICIRSMIEPGDEVILPEPCFVAYSPIIKLSGGTVVPIETKAANNFKLTPEQLAEKITNKTKMLVLPYPCNPTGGIMRKDDLEAIAKLLRGTNIMVLSDEIYSELTYDGKHVSIASLDGMRERCVVINGFSKAYAMTGWRLGFTAGPVEIIEQMAKIHQYAIMCSPTTSQHAAYYALKSCDLEIKEMVEEYDMRRRFIVKELNDMNLACFNPEGAFYAFPDITSAGLNSEAFCEKLLETKKVAVVPGTAFGTSGEGFVRISYCYSLEHISEALKRIKEFLNEI